MRHKLVRAAFALLLLSTSPALADPAGTLKRWYDGLAAGDAAVLAPLIAGDAVFVLEDIGIEQSRDEFLESLPEWRDAIAGGSIRWRLEEDGTDSATVVVCYRFAEGAVETREVFTFAGERILRSEQAETGEDCGGS